MIIELEDLLKKKKNDDLFNILKSGLQSNYAHPGVFLSQYPIVSPY